MSYPVMTHMVAYYPDRERSIQIARALERGGASYLEIQFPFSDPTADGPVIQRACSRALASGFVTKGGFSLVKDLKSESKLPIFIMSYGALVYACGVEAFVFQAAQAGASGLIIPDLPIGHDEGLYQLCRQYGIECVPVVTMNMIDYRLSMILEQSPGFIYCALRAGITGQRTELSDEQTTFLSLLGSNGSKVLGGFGIRSEEQIRMVCAHANAAVIGSRIVEAIDEGLAAGRLEESISALLESWSL